MYSTFFSNIYIKSSSKILILTYSPGKIGDEKNLKNKRKQDFWV